MKNNSTHSSLTVIPARNPQQKEGKPRTAISRCASESMLTSAGKLSGSTSELRPGTQTTTGKNLKLRDYLFLVNVNSKRPRGDSPDPAPTPSTHCLKNSLSARSIKYGIDNRHLLSVVAAELQADLATVLSLAGTISEGLQRGLREGGVGEEEMVEIYALRRRVKEKVLKELEEISEFVVGREKAQESKRLMEDRVGMSMSIIYEKDELKKKEEECLVKG
jgi:hypothetical protein